MLFRAASDITPTELHDPSCGGFSLVFACVEIGVDESDQLARLATELQSVIPRSGNVS